MNTTELLREAREKLDPFYAAILIARIDAALAEPASTAPARWYCVDSDGAATLCVDEADATEVAAQAGVAFPRQAPHRAVQLVELARAMQGEQP